MIISLWGAFCQGAFVRWFFSVWLLSFIRGGGFFPVPDYNIISFYRSYFPYDEKYGLCKSLKHFPIKKGGVGELIQKIKYFKNIFLIIMVIYKM
jgi:hypothetical protein